MDISSFIESMIEGGVVLQSFAITLATFVLGWFYMLSGALRATKLSKPHGGAQYGWPSVLARLGIGSTLTQASTFISMWVLTVTGQVPTAPTAMSVVSSGGSPATALIFKAALVWLAMLGVVAIIRGLQLLIKAGDSTGGGGGSDREPLTTGFIFLVSGAIGVNMSRFVGWLF